MASARLGHNYNNYNEVWLSLLYFRRCAEMFIASIICSVPAYSAVFHIIPQGSDLYIKMQLLFFCLYIFFVILSQSRVYVFDRRRSYYLTLSVVGIMPYTLLSLVCFFALPAKFFSLIFQPSVFFALLGCSKLVSVLLTNLMLYIIVLIYPSLRHSLKR